jgi:eukaryotic-like serine/threonine-protein kinase
MWICTRCRATTEQDGRLCAHCGGRIIDELSYQRLGTTVGNYKLLDVIGRGGMGTVYRGEHVYIGRPVAVKILHAQFARYEEAVKRFLREARAASSINHPNIVDVTDFGPTPDHGVYFVMEYIEGESLEDLIARESPLALHRAINIINQLASALGKAHELGVIHRDLKPENVMLASRPGRRDLIRFVNVDKDKGGFVIEREEFYDFVKILDFGIAKVLEQPDPAAGHTGATSAGHTIAGAVFGTPEYMSPEAAQGLPVDHRSDVYSLGILFYDMLVGHVPFEAEAAADVMQQQIHKPPVPPRRARPDAEITEAAERFILKALAKRPEDRQQTMDDLRTELQTCYGSVAYRRNAPRIEASAPSAPAAWHARPTHDTSQDLADEPTSPAMVPKKDPPG